MSRRTLPRSVYALGFVSMFMDLSSEMIHSLLPIFLMTSLGATAIAVGLIEGIAEATANIVKIFSGALSDAIGKRKPLLLLGYGLATVTRPLFPMAESMSAVLTARFTDRIGKGIRVAPRDALMADVTPADVRGAAYGMRQTLDTMGSILGPLAAILLMLATANDFRFVFWASIIPAVIVLLIIIFGIREPDIPRERKKHPFPLKASEIKKLNRAFWLVTWLSVILTLARFSDAFLVLRGDSLGLGPAFAPMILMVMNAAFALSSYPAGLAADRIGMKGLFLSGIGVLILADLVLAFAVDGWMVFAGAALWGLHMGLTQGITTAFIAQEAPAHLRGTAFGMYNLLTGVALLLASLGAGAIWHYVGATETFIAGSLFALLSLFGFMRIKYIFGKD